MLQFLRIADGNIGGVIGSEEGLETVIVRLQDRVKLMIMTTRATDGESQEYLAGRVRQVVQDFLAALLEVDGVVFFRVMPVEAGRDQGGAVLGITATRRRSSS